VDGHQVTAVGEVPTRTLKAIATSLRPASAPGAARAAANRRD
jgi:negative regulator of sigma E activity